MKRRRGLTLLEVIVAMTLLAIGIAGAMGAISACVRSNEAAASYSRGTLLAQQVAAELERSETLESGEMSGTFDNQSSEYTWEALVDGADAQGLYPVHITVRWQAGQRCCELRSLLRPRALPAPTASTAPIAPTAPTAPTAPAAPDPPAAGGVP